ncbi:pyridoxal phosphate-dependent transferase [Mariannaea sp. PMI_226]|nr:pyridoxal phosphate-dependent transferase [Mariannaea sp. PMI_226]
MLTHAYRKIRNRISQRAFRRRQVETLRELRERVNAGERSQDEQVAALQQENKRLRANLVEVQAKLSRLLASIQLMSDDVLKTLDGDNTNQEAVESDDQAISSTQSSRDENDSSNGNGKVNANVNGGGDSNSDVNRVKTAPSVTSMDLSMAAVTPYQPATPRETGTMADGLICQQIPNIWTFQYQMGLEPYMNAMAATQQSNITLGREWGQSNSPFSDHIQVLQRLLKDKFSMMDMIPNLQRPTLALYQPVLMVLSMFNSLTRPDVMAWYAKTRFYHIIELTAWQLFPSTSTYERLHDRYRPTNMQLTYQHPLVIDWIPFPSIRDRLIQLHAANPGIDKIFCDAVSGYVVEAIMSDLILGAPAIQVYIRVTDLITGMSASPSGQRIEEAVLPAPDIASLFDIPEYAAAAFNFLNMNCGAGYYKIDPAFFVKYPELYDPTSPMTANGIPLKPNLQIRLTWPKPLDATTVETYRSFIHFSIDAANTISPVSSISVMAEPISPRVEAKYSFLDDYSEGAHPLLLNAIFTSNGTQETGYGNDKCCKLARQRIRRHLGRDDVGIFFVPSGTSANAISIAACLRPHEAVIAASSGHIVTRETGAVEASGHKIINATPRNGKLTPEIISRALDDNWHFPHMAKPRMVYISNATEIGTIYSKDELRAIKDLCERNNLLLFLDGARIGAALSSKANDMTLGDILELTDIFWIGGTKNGALLGEAVVVKDAGLASEFEFYVKQHGSLLAKSRVMGAQFAELFRENLYFELALAANLAAEKLSCGIRESGFEVYAATETNQVFAVLPLGLIAMLQEKYTFYVWEKVGVERAVVRLLTTWATLQEQIDGFIEVAQQWAKVEAQEGEYHTTRSGDGLSSKL